MSQSPACERLLPELGQPEPGNRGSGTYTVLLLIDDLQSFRTQQAAMAERDTLDVTTAGIRSDVEEDQTDAIQALVDRGGVIHFPAGIYRVRRLKIPSDTTIHLAAGAVLRSSDGAEVGKSAPFLDLKGSQRVRICGPGTIDGNGRPYHLVQTEDSRDVTIEDCLLRNCTSWAIHLLLVDKAACRNVRVLSGKDGIDPDCARDVQIENCLIMAKDDGIAVKTRKPPATTERVTVRNCIVASDASALKIGTETRSLIRDVTFENCDVFDSDQGIILYARDGGPIEKVTWRNIHMQMIDWPHEDRGSPFQLVISERDGKTPVRECVVENVKTNCRAPSRFAGLAETPLDGVAFRNIMLQVDPPATGEGRPLLDIALYVNLTIDGLQIDWQGNRNGWSGVQSADGVLVH